MVLKIRDAIWGRNALTILQNTPSRAERVKHVPYLDINARLTTILPRNMVHPPVSSAE
jgi:hypothetical protein